MYWSLILITFRETYFLRGGTRLISKGFSHSLDDKRQYLVPEWLLKQANIVSAPWYRHCWCMQRLICTCSCCLNPLCVFFGFILTLFLLNRCGSGLSGESITEQGHYWVGMDISSHMLGESITSFSVCVIKHLFQYLSNITLWNH